MIVPVILVCSSFLINVCMFIVSNAFLISSATVLCDLLYYMLCDLLYDMLCIMCVIYCMICCMVSCVICCMVCCVICCMICLNPLCDLLYGMFGCLLCVPPISKTCANSFFDRSFVYAAPTLWNALDFDIRLSPFDAFKKRVKTHPYLKYFSN